MFYLTFNKRKTLIVLVVINLLLIAVSIFAAVSALSERLDNFNSRKVYLENLGYKIDENFNEEIKVMTLPTKFSKVDRNYNELQKRNGFNLEK